MIQLHIELNWMAIGEPILVNARLRSLQWKDGNPLKSAINSFHLIIKSKNTISSIIINPKSFIVSSPLFARCTEPNWPQKGYLIQLLHKRNASVQVITNIDHLWTKYHKWKLNSFVHFYASQVGAQWWARSFKQNLDLGAANRSLTKKKEKEEEEVWKN